MIGRRASKVVFWPIIVSGVGIATVLLGVLQRWQELAYASAYTLMGAFLIALVALAGLRARWGNQPGALPALLCTAPVLLSMVLSPPDWSIEPTELHYSGFRVWAQVDLRALGATLSLSLLLAEVLALTRFLSPSRPKWAPAIGVLLAIPFQLPWLIPIADMGFSAEIVAALMCSIFALVALPLSLFRGGSETARIIVALAVAQAMVSLMFGHVLVDHGFGYHGCGPTPKSVIVAHYVQALYPVVLLEQFPWLPGALALLGFSIHVRVPRNVGGPLLAAAVVLLAIPATIRRTSHLISDDALSPIGSEFRPRGTGRAYLRPLRISEAAIFNPEGVALVREPFAAGSEELGPALKQAAQAVVFDWCWRRSRDHLLSMVDVALDARLNNDRLLEVIAASRAEGIQAIRFVEGESQDPPGDPSLVSTHVMALVEGSAVGTLVIEPASLAEYCRPLRAMRLKPETNVMGEFRAVDDVYPALVLDDSSD